MSIFWDYFYANFFLCIEEKGTSGSSFVALSTKGSLRNGDIWVSLVDGNERRRMTKAIVICLLKIRKFLQPKTWAKFLKISLNEICKVFREGKGDY